MDRWALMLLIMFAASLALTVLVSQPRPEPVVIVAIDAGHGGHDPGATVSGVREKDINLALALLVQEKASTHGLKVILTRSADAYIDLVKRLRLAESAGAVLYVSIHVNFHRDQTVCGVETWVDTNATAESLRLAQALQNAVVSATGAQDRGVHRQALYLRHSSLPAALVEMGYLTCPSEREKLLSREYQERLAHGIVQGILGYLRR